MNQIDLESKVREKELAVFNALTTSPELVVKYFAYKNATKKSQGYFDAWCKRPENKTFLNTIEVHNKKAVEAREALNQALDELDHYFPLARSDEEKDESVLELMQRRFGNRYKIIGIQQ